MTAMADGMSNKAGAQWDKLESIFEERVAKALHKMGVPSRQDIDALAKRIDGLSARAGGKAAAKAAPARKAAAKPAAAARKSPAKRAVRKAA